MWSGSEMEYTYVHVRRALVFDMFITTFFLLVDADWISVPVCEALRHSIQWPYTRVSRIDATQNCEWIWIENEFLFTLFRHIPWIVCYAPAYSCSIARFGISKCNNQYARTLKQTRIIKYSMAVRTWCRYTVNVYLRWMKIVRSAFVCCRRPTITITANAHNTSICNLQITPTFMRRCAWQRACNSKHCMKGSEKKGMKTLRTSAKMT